MAGLYKQPGSSRWTAVFTDATGKQIRRSTKQRDRKAAMSIGVAWEKAAQEAREGRLFEAQARRIVSEMMEQTTGQPLHFHTCREWFDEWIKGKAGSVEQRTMLKYSQVTGNFLTFLGDRAELPLPTISLSDVRGYRDALVEKGVSSTTVNQSVRKVLSVPFESARKLGYVPINPCAGVEAIKDKIIIKKDTFTPEQVKALVDAAEGDWKGLIIAEYTTGLRLGDVAHLCWSNVDMEAAFVHVQTSKTGKLVHLPILPDMAKWLSAQPRGIGQAPLFPSLYGQAGTGRCGLSMQFKRIMERAGIRGRVLRSGKGAGRTTSSLSFHSLRHTYNSQLANAGVPQEIRQKLTGHSSAEMNTKYSHLELETLRAAAAKLPAIGA